MVFKWKPKVSIPVDAQVAGDEIQRITKEKGGVLKASDVVEAAKPKRSPLHPAFEWDDTKAARSYREDQARHMIRSIVVVREDDEGKKKNGEDKVFRAFIHSESEDGYCTVHRTMSDEDLREEALARAWKELKDWRRRYSDFKDLAKVFEVIDYECARKSI
jgi:hypothetical protein